MSQPVKCPACGILNTTLVTINGHTACTFCDGEFCFRCGLYPVELVGDEGVCIPCYNKQYADRPDMLIGVKPD